MNQSYLFLADFPLDKRAFREGLSSLDASFRLEFLDERKGLIHGNAGLGSELSVLLPAIHEDLGANITILAIHRETPLTRKLMKEAIGYFPNKVLYISDILLKEFSFGDFSSLPLLSAEFKDVPHELMLTAGAFLRSGLNASLAAKTLFIHRNTLNYRMRAFIDLTGLDIREYHNALLLELYFQFAYRGS